MAAFERTVEFLPSGTELMVAVKPSGDVKSNLWQHIVRNIKVAPPAQGFYVPLFLDDPLQIQFRISRRGKIKRDLLPCKCHTPVLPDVQLGSLNNAYQKISGEIEQHRISQGGKVYFNIYYEDDGYWKLLDELREKIYQPHEAEFEEHSRVITEKVAGYIKPLPATHRLFALEVQSKNKLITALQSQTEDLQKKLEQLTLLLEKSKLVSYQQKLEEFRQRLETDHPETNSPESWQEWIYKNTWLFGIQYGDPIGHPRVGFRSILDYLFPTPDGFIDILEIKKPTYEVIKEDKSHRGAFYWSAEANAAIGQVVNYLHEIEVHQLEIAQKLRQEHSLKHSTIKPRAFLLIGRSDDWNEVKREALRKLNHSLHEIEVITYTDLLRRGENLIRVYGD